MQGIDLSKFVIVRHVTRPLLKMVENGDPTFIKIEGPFFTAEQVKNPKKTKVKVKDPVTGVEAEIEQIQPPPTIVHVTDLTNGVASQMVANEVFKSEISKQYPNDNYVGKYFQLKKNTKAEGKNYNTFDITELKPAEEEKTTEQAPAATQVSSKRK